MYVRSFLQHVAEGEGVDRVEVIVSRRGYLLNQGARHVKKISTMPLDEEHKITADGI